MKKSIIILNVLLIMLALVLPTYANSAQLIVKKVKISTKW